MIAIIEPEQINKDSLLNLSFYGLGQTAETLGLSCDRIKESEFSSDRAQQHLILILLDPCIYKTDIDSEVSRFLEKGGIVIKSDFNVSGASIKNGRFFFGGKECRYILPERWVVHKDNHQVFENVADKLPFFFFENNGKRQDGSRHIEGFDIVDNDNSKIMPAADFTESAKGKTIQFHFPLFANIGFILAGADDLVPSRGIKKDHYGRTIGKSSLSCMHKLLDEPIVHNLQVFFLNILAWLTTTGRIPLAAKWFWPDFYKMSVCLTHDVDDVMGYAHLLRRLGEVIFKEKLPLKRKITALRIAMVYAYNRFLFKRAPSLKRIYGIFENEIDAYEVYFKEWVELEREFGFRATYFLLSRFDFDFKDTEFQRIAGILKADNFDIEVHGSIECSDDPARMSEEREYFRNKLESEPEGIRQHGLVFRMPQSWETQSRAGYSFDSSVSYNDAYGFRMGTSFPFRTYRSSEDGESSITELPLIIMEETLFAKEYLGLSEKEGVNIYVNILDKIRKYNGCFTMLWHPVTILEKYLKLNRWKYNLRLDTLGLFRSVLEELARCREYIWVATAKDIAGWWENRNKVILQMVAASKEESHFEILNTGTLRKITVRLFTDLDVKAITVKENGKAAERNYTLEENKYYKSFFIPLEIPCAKNDVVIYMQY